MSGRTIGASDPIERTPNGGPGWVFWITGLAASGKTSAAHSLVARLRALGHAAVLLDGDELREALGEPGYAPSDRRRCARSYARLGALLAGQGLYAVVATISMFADVRRRNRSAIPHYFEVYLRVPFEVRRRRDRLGIYRGRDVVGVDQPWDEPTAADLVIDGGSLSPSDIAGSVLEHWGKRCLGAER